MSVKKKVLIGVGGGSLFVFAFLAALAWIVLEEDERDRYLG